jgi:hypothetical protein
VACIQQGEGNRQSRLRDRGSAEAGSAGRLHTPLPSPPPPPPHDKIVIADWDFQTRSEHTVIQLCADAAIAARLAATYYCALMKLCDEEDVPH